MQMPRASYDFVNPLVGRLSSPELIAESLRKAIIEGQLSPGEVLRQENLAQHFSVSRIPVREALRQLESEGWVELLRHKGARVSPLSADEVREIYEIRASLEATALKLAVPRHDAQSLERLAATLRIAHDDTNRLHDVDHNRAFHLALYEPAERPRLLDLIRALHAQGERYLRLKLATPALKHQSDEEHRQILVAVCAGDVDAAVHLLEPHLLQTGEMLAQYVTEHLSAKPEAAGRPRAPA